MKPTKKSLSKLAGEIAESLFTDSHTGKVAYRLARQEDQDSVGRIDLTSGWCQSAVKDRILARLKQNLLP